MSETIKITINGTEHTINCVEVDGAKWFRGKDIATVLGYKSTKSAIIAHVIIDNKRQLK
ncbi:MAG: Bro-N domain-containing protein [Candidatus Fonsibacter sp.]